MKQVNLSWLMIVCLCTILLVPTTAMAAPAPASPELQLSANEVKGEVQINISGTNFNDLYAFDLTLTFDPLRMKLKKSSSTMMGFTIPAVIKGNSIAFAHTKTGPVEGNTGSFSIADLVFERIGGGEAKFTLNKATLVDSKLQSTLPKINQNVKVDGGAGAILFTDISGHWAEKNIKAAAELGFVSGYKNNQFMPNQQVTRAEFAAMLTRALKLPEGSELVFADTAQIPEWAKPYISSAVAAKAVSGYNDNTFRANRTISRAEMAAMVVRAATLYSSEGGETGFADESEIAAWAKLYVKSAVDAGIIKGKGDNRFAPNDQLTRAEAVTVLMNVLNKMAQ
ncbi:S-layer homology domain-containing protein [Paenibacillus paridis]|uniref:S-layer homology domain-containing protein n=1 Tax=Paenibacillus paridis TaxID=2583376 RepID=UPI0013915F4F|nr:S-layer homology domain-containing protein [Paenibacillus paridis]